MSYSPFPDDRKRTIMPAEPVTPVTFFNDESHANGTLQPVAEKFGGESVPFAKPTDEMRFLHPSHSIAHGPVVDDDGEVDPDPLTGTVAPEDELEAKRVKPGTLRKRK